MTQDLVKTGDLDYLGRTLLAAVPLGVEKLGDTVAVNLTDDDAVEAELQAAKVDDYLNQNIWLKGFVIRRDLVNASSGQYEGLVCTLAIITEDGEPMMVNTTSQPIANRLIRLSNAGRFGASPLPTRIVSAKNGSNTFYDLAPQKREKAKK